MQIRYTEDTGSFLVESNHAGAVDTLKKLASDNSEGQRYMLVPAKVSNTILKWLPQVQSMGMLVYGDNAVPWRQSSAALLHRSASELDQASVRLLLWLGWREKERRTTREKGLAQERGQEKKETTEHHDHP